MNYGIFAIVAICTVVLCIGILKKRAQIIFRFFFRVVLGLISIYFTNRFFETQDVALFVGLNPGSALTVGTLGFSGFVLLYGIMLYRIL
jgi:hypothetical protein